MLASFLAIPGAFFPVMPAVTGFAWMLGLLLIAGAVTGVVTATALAVVVPNEMRGLCMSLFIVVGAILGLGLAPTLVTLVGDALGGEQMLNWGLTLVSLVTSAVSALGFVFALRHEAQWRPR
jgi:MFS family permease